MQRRHFAKRLRIIYAILLLLITVPVAAATTDLSRGFMDIAWGTAIDELDQLRRIYSKAPVDFFMNPSKLHVIQGYEIPNLVYGFYNQQFFAIYINIDTIEVYSHLKRYISDKYGEPKMTMSSKSQQTIYKWNYKGVRIKLKYMETSGKMKLAFYYLPLAQALNEAQLDNYQEHSWRFLPVDKNKRPAAIPLLEF
jgi:hypothetical protein